MRQLLIAAGIVATLSVAMAHFARADQTPMPYDSKECAGVRQVVAINDAYLASSDWVDAPETTIVADIEAQTASIRASVPYCWIIDRSDRYQPK